MIKFYLPHAEHLFNLNKEMALYLKNHQEYFYDNIQIGGFYGCFPGMIWNGGRAILPNSNMTINHAEEVVSLYNSLEIPFRFTMTNCLITKSDCYDSFCNGVLSKCENYLNEVLVSSPILEEHLRRQYPNYKYVSSTTKCILDKDAFIEELKKYYMVVLDYRLNKDIDFLSSIARKNKVELLVDAFCSESCVRRSDHYKALSMQQKTFEIGTIQEPFCNIKKNNFYEALTNKSTINKDDLYNVYVKMGYSNFKLEGRTDHIVDVLLSYIYYMVKDEYKLEVTNNLLKRVL